MGEIVRLLAAVAALLISLLASLPAPWRPGAGEAWAATLVHLEPVLSGLASPVHVTSARDGSHRLFVVEQGGVIRVVQPGSTTPTVFLDIHTRVLAGGERGLLGLAFHPDFAGNRRFFVNYTRAGDGATVIAQYHASEADPDVADTTEAVFLVIPQPFANHNGGMIAFGPEGYLYIGMGDGGSGNDPGNRAQNLDDLLGKMLRIDVDQPGGQVPYSSPADNPFVGLTPGRDEIFAYGFRNPWRFSFDRLTGALYVGDVGQGAREEIDVVTRGGNYGWRVREGVMCTGLDPDRCDDPGLAPPLLDYPHKKGRCSVTGGYVYRGTLGTLPAGTYIFADYCTGEVFYATGAGGRALLLSTGLLIPSFGEDEAGELYIVGSGGVHRIAAGAACSFAVAPPGQSLSVAAQSATATVSAPAGCAWSAMSHDSWITVTAGGTGSGPGSVRYSVTPNSGSPGPRTGALTIAGQPFTVTQAGSPLACLSSITPFLHVIPAGGGAGTVAVTIGSGCAWTAVSQSPWITVTAGASGAGNGTVRYVVAPGRGVRSGSITIAGRAFRVFSF